MNVPYVNLGLQFSESDLAEIHSKMDYVLRSGQYIFGEELSMFEKNFATLCDSKYAIGVANGTDALILALKALGIKEGDEVITAPNSYLASASSIVLAGATPVFADVGDDYNIDPEAIKASITKKTKAIIPVHLTGNPAKMTDILAIAKEFNLFIIEDCAQAVGAKYKGMPVGSIGDIGCFSLHPLKNLGAVGDAGVITTNNSVLYDFLIKARNHGLKSRDECEFFSLNSRLDNIQAVILNVKMRHLQEWNQKRRNNASYYNKNISDFLRIPLVEQSNEAVYHAYVVQTDRRSDFIQFLLNRGIETKIHYPIPIHLQEAMVKYINGPLMVEKTEEQMNKIVSLPIYPELSEDQLKYVVSTITDFFTNS